MIWDRIVKWEHAINHKKISRLIVQLNLKTSSNHIFYFGKISFNYKIFVLEWGITLCQTPTRRVVWKGREWAKSLESGGSLSNQLWSLFLIVGDYCGFWLAISELVAILDFDYGVARLTRGWGCRVPYKNNTELDQPGFPMDSFKCTTLYC